MSLKAKVEAIIYAAEEPITVEQIAQLLRDQILAEQARLASEAQVAAEAKATEDAQNAAEGPSAAVEGATSVEAAESSTPEDHNPTLSPSEKDGAPAEQAVDESGLGAEASGGGIDETAQVSSASLLEPGAPEVEPAESVEAAEANTPVVDGTAIETPAEAVAEEPAPADSARVDPPAGPGKRQKKTKEELAVDAKVRAHVRALIAELMADYENEDRGIEVRQVAGGYRMSTKPEHHDVVRAFAKSLKPPVRLSLAALETLAVIAYKQPITVPEISEIRGVESGGVIATLLDRKLITTAGRKQVIGRPILYKTAKEFLLRFGLNDVSELPSMEEFEKLAAEGLGVSEEQTNLDLQPATSDSSATTTEHSEEATTPLQPTDGFHPDDSIVGDGDPGLNGAPTEGTPEQQDSVADESQSGTQSEEPQHS